MIAGCYGSGKPIRLGPAVNQSLDGLHKLYYCRGRILCIRRKRKEGIDLSSRKEFFTLHRSKKCSMRVLLNTISAKMGRAANYARNIVVELAKVAPNDEFIIALLANQVRAIEGRGQIFA
jgi:hypothetical protein